jgi:acyl-CoA synthetase (NDP forming)
MARDEAIDAVIAIFVPPLVTAAGDVAAALTEAARGMPDGKPLLAVFIDEAGPPAALRDGSVPAFSFPEDAALALARAAEYGRWRRRPPRAAPALDPEPDRDAAAAVLAEALAAKEAWLRPERVTALAASYGLPLVRTGFARNAAEAVRIAAEHDGPVALKAVAPGLIHKTDAGGVAVGLRGAAAVRRAAAKLRADVARAGFRLDGYVVQPMARPGVEMHVGVTGDGQFRPLVACAAGGVAAELIDDVAIRLAPLTADDPAEMLRELATFPLLDGYRGAPPGDVTALEDVIARVGALAAENPAIAELDCNPVIVGPAGATIVDIRVRVADPGPAAGVLPGTLAAPASEG